MKEKVLILGVASVQMDALIMLKKMGYETYACAMSKDGPGADIADHFAPINIRDVDQLRAYIEENGISAVYSVGSDLAMPIACDLSEQLGLPHFVSKEAAYICNHKNLMRKTLTNECQGNIPYQVMREPEQVTIPFPCILKPSDSQGQRGIFLITTQQGLDDHFDEVVGYSRDKAVILEKYIDGPELSVNGYLVDGVLRYLVASDRDTWPQYTGLIHKHIVPSRILNLVSEQRVRAVFEDACARMGISNGPAYFQIKLEGDTPYIIEMTPRLDGCHMWNILEKSTGLNLLQLTFDHLLKNDVSTLTSRSGIVQGYELVFFCQEPRTVMNRSAFTTPPDAVESSFYYQTGETVRPVNGRYEKVGYYMRRFE